MTEDEARAVAALAGSVRDGGGLRYAEGYACYPLGLPAEIRFAGLDALSAQCLNPAVASRRGKLWPHLMMPGKC